MVGWTLPEIETEGLGLGPVIRLALARVRQCGVAVVRHGSSDSTPPDLATAMVVTALEAAGLRAVTTRRGRLEDVRPGPGDVVELRTDLPFLPRPPRFVLLRCLGPADERAALVLADARAAFEAVVDEDVRAAALLLGTPVRFEDERGSHTIVAPMLTRDGDRFQVRGGPFLLTPQRLTLAATKALCAAHEQLSRQLHDPRYSVRIGLERGDWLLLDNHRILHAHEPTHDEVWLRRARFEQT